MEEKNKPRKNHRTQTNVNNATQKINREVYKRNRQAPIQMKMDDMSIFINNKITRRGIAKGLVCIQEDLNKWIIEAEKKTIYVLLIQNREEQYKKLMEVEQIIKVKIWTDIRFLMVNKAITPGEITELIRMQNEIDKDIERWKESIQKAIPAIR